MEARDTVRYDRASICDVHQFGVRVCDSVCAHFAALPHMTHRTVSVNLRAQLLYWIRLEMDFNFKKIYYTILNVCLVRLAGRAGRAGREGRSTDAKRFVAVRRRFINHGLFFAHTYCQV